MAGVPSVTRVTGGTGQQLDLDREESEQTKETKARLTIRLVALDFQRLLSRLDLEQLDDTVRIADRDQLRVRPHGSHRRRDDPLAVLRDLLLRVLSSICPSVSPASNQRDPVLLRIPNLHVPIRTHTHQSLPDQGQAPDRVRVSDEDSLALLRVVIRVQFLVRGGQLPDPDGRIERAGEDALLVGGKDDRGDACGVAAEGLLGLGVLGGGAVGGEVRGRETPDLDGAVVRASREGEVGRVERNGADSVEMTGGGREVTEGRQPRCWAEEGKKGRLTDLLSVRRARQAPPSDVVPAAGDSSSSNWSSSSVRLAS